MKYVFVILHYRTYIDTIECIQSIQRLNGVIEIVVVDNYSNNGSIEKVEEYVGDSKGIYILKNTENLGFSSGNNVGYEFAKRKLNADFVLVSNNDIVIKDKAFVEKLDSFYLSHPFHVCGPDIISLSDGGHQNPKVDSIPNINKARSERQRYFMLYVASKLNIYDLLKKQKTKSTAGKKTDYSYEFLDDSMLHGAFVIFSPKYVKEEQYAFQPGPFLYCEEAILYRYCSNKKYKMVFYPKICVFHKEDSSTNDLCISNKKKREFVFWNMYKSLGILIKFMHK